MLTIIGVWANFTRGLNHLCPKKYFGSIRKK